MELQHLTICTSSLSVCVCVVGWQELYIYDTAGKEVFADFVPEYVSHSFFQHFVYLSGVCALFSGRTQV